MYLKNYVGSYVTLVNAYLTLVLPINGNMSPIFIR